MRPAKGERARFRSENPLALSALALAAALGPAVPWAATPPPSPIDPALKERCTAGEIPACTRALREVLIKRQVPTVKAKLPGLVRECEQGASDSPWTAEACASAAVSYLFPDPSVRNPEEAARLARKACNLGSPLGCRLVELQEPRKKGAPKLGAPVDLSVENPLPYQSELDGCDRGELDSCATLGNLLRRDTDPQLAELGALLQKATCAHGVGSGCGAQGGAAGAQERGR